MEGEVIEITLDELKKQLGADKIEFVDSIEQTNKKRGGSAMTEKNNRIQDLIHGKVKSGNTYVNYALEQFRTKKVAFDSLQNNIRQLEVQMRQAQEKAIRLAAQCDQCVEDITRWDKPTEKKE